MMRKALLALAVLWLGFVPAADNLTLLGVSGGAGTSLFKPGFFIGVNLAGMDFGGGPFPPTTAQEDYFNAKNIKTIRLPFLWEEAQPTLYGALSGTILSDIDALVARAASNSQRVVLDLHNYAQYNSNPIGSAAVPISAYANVWTLLAEHYAGTAGIYAYDIMNEPNDITLPAWQAAAQAAINAIRAVDTKTPILVECIGFSAAPQWLANCNNFSVTDPARNFAYDAHAYADSNNSGSYANTYASDGATPTIMSTRMAIPIGWASSFNVPMIHGEGGLPKFDPAWLTVLDNFYAYMRGQNEPTLYWADGAFGQSYPLNPSPASSFLGATLPNSAVRDVAQMAVITKYTGAAQPVTHYVGGPVQGPSATTSAIFYDQYFGTLASTVTSTPSDGGGGGTFSPSACPLLPAVFNPVCTFIYTPGSAGGKTITFGTGAALTSTPASLAFTSTTVGSLSAYELMPGPIEFFWSAAGKVISTYSATGNWADLQCGSGGSPTTKALVSGVPPSAAALQSFCAGVTASCATTGLYATKLYDEGSGANNAITFTGRDPPGLIINAQNGLPGLCFAGGGGFNGNDQGLASPASIDNLAGASVFVVGEPANTTASYFASFVNQWYYPYNGTVANPDTNIAITAGITDTANYHQYIGSLQAGDFNNFTNSYVDGALAATAPSIDVALPISSTLDIGFFRFFQPAAYQGTISQIAVIGAAPSAGDIIRAHTLDKANFGTP